MRNTSCATKDKKEFIVMQFSWGDEHFIEILPNSRHATITVSPLVVLEEVTHLSIDPTLGGLTSKFLWDPG